VRDMTRCPKCKKSYSKAELKQRREAKVKNLLKSLAKARRNGTKLGRKKIRDDDQIKKLRAQGFTLREIAAKIGLSMGTVQRGLE